MSNKQIAGEYCLALDVGGTHIKTGVFDADGQLMVKGSVPSDEMGRSDDPVGEMIRQVIEPVMKDFPLRSIGIGVPGVLSKDRATVLEAPNFTSLNGINLRGLLEQHFPQLDIRVENDANAAALGAYYFDDSIREDTFGFITIGTGIGSAAIVDGCLFTGGNGNGLELGTLPSWDGRMLEENIGRVGLGARAARHAKGMSSRLSGPSEPSPEVIFHAAQKGDGAALRTLDEAGTMLAEGLAAFILIMDVTTLYVGGGIAPCFEHMLPAVMRFLNQRLTPYYLRTLSLRKAEIGNDAGIRGAAALCLDPNPGVMNADRLATPVTVRKCG